MKATSTSGRRLALCLAAAQLFAVAHMALVPHTTTVAGGLADVGSSIQEHLDAATHSGPHAHTQAPLVEPQGEESCAVASLLSASADGPRAPRVLVLPAERGQPGWSPAVAPDLSRRERLLAAPKASPPSFVEA